ncbi:hypothetical protein [Ramlibacter sp.]|uniref:hypothetical protein n=1 Tax=Ramlibacter sp. TaxID=1917967 RepID=UPI0017FACDD6|nr:hypothetical protein [Ramlibacter sp.]MBA2676527.1 hypothetical protein [Ramlibacter sp.]
MIPRSSNRFFAPRAAAALLLAALLGAGGAVQAAPDDKFLAAFNRFKEAAAGDADAVAGASDAFGALLKSEPGNPVLLAYVGATTSMRARTTLIPWKKLSYAEDGLAQIDKALALAAATPNLPAQRGTPGALELKYVAASTMLVVPGFMNRGARGAKLLGEVLDSPAFAAAPAGFRGEVLLRAGELAVEQKRTPEARRYLGEVIAMGAPQTETAKAKLREVAP